MCSDACDKSLDACGEGSICDQGEHGYKCECEPGFEEDPFDDERCIGVSNFEGSNYICIVFRRNTSR